MFGDLDTMTTEHFSKWAAPACKQLADALASAQGHKRQVGTNVPLRLPAAEDGDGDASAGGAAEGDSSVRGRRSSAGGGAAKGKYITINFKVCALLERRRAEKLKTLLSMPSSDDATSSASPSARKPPPSSSAEDRLLGRRSSGEERLRLAGYGRRDERRSSLGTSSLASDDSISAYDRIGTLLVVEDTTIVSTM